MTAITRRFDWATLAPTAWPSARSLVLWAAFVVGYCLLDRLDMMRFPVSNGQPLSDLAGGLALALLVRQGPRMAPLVIAADVLSNLLAPGPHPPIAAFACSALALGAAYAMAAIYLRRFSIAAPDSQLHFLPVLVVAHGRTQMKTNG